MYREPIGILYRRVGGNCQVDPIKREESAGLDKNIRELPDLDIGQVKNYLLATKQTELSPAGAAVIQVGLSTASL